MSIVEKIRALCEEKGETFASLERKMDFGNGTIRRWENALPSADKLSKVADYFGVSTDFLLGRESKSSALPFLNQRDERDIEKRLESMLGELDGKNADSLMFSGEPLDDETRELLRISLRNQLELSKQIAKKKYTPKKYRKEGD